MDLHGSSESKNGLCPKYEYGGKVYRFTLLAETGSPPKVNQMIEQ